MTKMSQDVNAYRVRVWDNFHYMEEEEAYDLAETFPTAEAAIAAAKGIVERSCAEVDYDYSTYTGFGEDPGVIAPPGAERVDFSAWNYAQQVCEAKRREDG